MEEPLPPPIPLALVICDGIYTDPHTGRKTLLGLYDEYLSRVFPAVVPVCHFYAEITECLEPIRLRVRITLADPEAEATWESDPLEVVPDSPLSRTALEWGVSELTFPDIGVYMVELVDEFERVILSRLLYINEWPRDSPPEDRDE